MKRIFVVSTGVNSWCGRKHPHQERMLASALRRDIGDRAFQDLQQSLLHAFTGNIAGDRRILVLATDLIDFVDVDDAGLCTAHITIGGLQQLEDDVLDILANISSFCERSRIYNREGNVQHTGQGLRQQRLAGAGGPDQHDVRLGQFDPIARLLAIHEDALVVVVDGNRQLLLGLLLPDYVFI